MGSDRLPPEMLKGASLRGNEYAWTLAAFPDALANAEAHGYGCLGGQFQFRTDDATCEMYWISADPEERRPNELWKGFVHRSSAEVIAKFRERVGNTDFRKKALRFAPLEKAMKRGMDPIPALAFVAYFVTESEFDGLDEAIRPRFYSGLRRNCS